MNLSKDIIPFVYVGSVTLGANGSGTFTIVLTIDSSFELHYVMGSCTEDTDVDVMPNNFSVQITDQGTGRQLSSARVPQRTMTGPANRDLFQHRPVVFPPSTTLVFDVLNLTGNSNTVTITLHGYKLFKPVA